MDEMNMDTSNYPTKINPQISPLQAMNEINQIRDATNRANILRGGMSGTQSALSQMGAGMPYGSAQPNYPTPVEGQ